MTAVALWCAYRRADASAVVRALLDQMKERGDVPRLAAASESSCIGTSVFRWQSEWVGSAIGRSGGVTVGADATLYFVDDLVASLRSAGVEPASTKPADLIAAAVRAWGEGAPSRLEGDFAFVAVDSDRGRILAARDWSGFRSLYVARASDGIGFASHALPLASCEGVDATLRLEFLAEAASGRFESNDTVFLGVDVVPAGSFVTAPLDGSDGARTVRFFEPPRFLEEEEPKVPFDAAARELRALLHSVILERVPSAGDVAVSLSGGRDSTAIYAVARKGVGERVRSVSVSYPEGDPARDDEIIEDVLRMAGGEPHWVRSSELSVLGGLREYAATCHEPFGHAFAEVHLALARAARAVGARVVLNGAAGDMLFSGEPTYTADLLRRGKLVTLAREWRKLGYGRDRRQIVQQLVKPNVGRLGKALLRRLRPGKELVDPFDHSIVPWVQRELKNAPEIRARHQRNFPSRDAAASAADFERRWLLLHPFYHRIFAEVHRLFLREGVELRSPLSDLRLLHFAASRPRWERRSGWQVKQLLRASLRDLLPESVIGDRPQPGGLTEFFLSQAIQRDIRRVSGVDDGNWVLAEAGVLDSVSFGKALARMEGGQDLNRGLSAIFTILAEVWCKSLPGKGFPDSISRMTSKGIAG